MGLSENRQVVAERDVRNKTENNLTAGDKVCYGRTRRDRTGKATRRRTRRNYAYKDGKYQYRKVQERTERDRAEMGRWCVTNGTQWEKMERPEGDGRSQNDSVFTIKGPKGTE